MTTVQVLHGDCLEIMTSIEPQSVDFVFADLPYAVTNCAWDQPHSR